MRIRTLLAAALAATLLIPTTGAWAIAPTDGGDLVVAFTEGTTETTVADTGGTGTQTGIVPAVEAPPETAEEDDQPWTQRYLAPTILVLGVLGLVASAIVYGLRIRSRYEVVD